MNEKNDGLPRLLLHRPLCVIDIETTGLDVANDRILTLAILRIEPPDLFSPEQRETRKTWMVNPCQMIPPDSTRIHGITDDMVKDCPPFKAVAAEIRAMLSDADLCGYNLRNFDVPLLWEEFYRAQIEWATDGIKVVDASEIFRKQEPRTLTAAVKKFCGREHGDAHEAMADVEATWDVLHGQLATYPELAKMNVAALAEFSSMDEYEGRPAKRLDLSGYIIEDADGIARYTLKKVRGVAVADDPGFGKWMLRSSFPMNTCRVVSKLLENL
jgi:DNA polymerase-3 subunit epsilon